MARWLLVLLLIGCGSSHSVRDRDAAVVVQRVVDAAPPPVDPCTLLGADELAKACRPGPVTCEGTRESFDRWARTAGPEVIVEDLVLGDRTEIIHEHLPDGSWTFALRMQQGASYLVLRPPRGCDDDLLALARLVIDRLPAAPPPADPCGFVTAADVEEICGYDGVFVRDAEACGGFMGRASPDYAPLSWMVRQTGGAALYDRLERKPGSIVDVTPLSLGDRAQLVDDHTAMETTTVTLRVQRGDTYLALRMAGSRHACRKERLADLARRALDRLPPSPPPP